MADNEGDGRHLYDLMLDPGECTDIARQYPEVHEELHARLVEAIGGLPPDYTGKAVEPGRW